MRQITHLGVMVNSGQVFLQSFLLEPSEYVESAVWNKSKGAICRRNYPVHRSGKQRD